MVTWWCHHKVPKLQRIMYKLISHISLMKELCWFSFNFQSSWMNPLLLTSDQVAKKLTSQHAKHIKNLYQVYKVLISWFCYEACYTNILLDTVLLPIYPKP